MSTSKDELEFEDLLQEVGDFGKYQKRLVWIFLVPAGILLPWYAMNILLMVYTPDYWCHVPQLAASNLSIDVQRHLTAPPDKSMCLMYDLNYAELLETENFNIDPNATFRSCTSWNYDTTYFEETASSKWNLVCDDTHYASLVMTLTYVGSITFTPFYSTLSDKVGRKPVFFLVVLVTAMSAITSVFMTDFTAFLVLRTINGGLMPSIFQLPFIIFTEIVGPSMRTRMNGVSCVTWSIGLCLLPLIAYWTRHWVTFGLATSAGTVLMFFYWRYLPESPRWLISQEKYKEATIVLARIAETNGKSLCAADLRLKINKLGERIKREKQLDVVSNTLTDLVRYPNLRKKFVILSFCWIADVCAYYGLQINVPNLDGNPFLNFFYLALVEVPGLIFCWYFLEKWGRRWCSVSTLIMSGSACLLVAIVPDMPYVAMVCSLIGKFGVTAAFMAVYQQSSELYPTTLRTIGMGMSATISQIANVIVPYVVFLAVYQKYIPFLIIGSACLLAGISASLLPETLNEILPQTVNDAEMFGKNHKFFSWTGTKVATVSADEHELPELLNKEKEQLNGCDI